tara:strand:- start:328 stop:783 length:456 start_codon:yes stop_codon:yes gene_type:complete
MLIAERRSYGNSLANMGFTHHNIIRFRRYDSNISNVNKLVKDEYSIYNDLSNDKLNFKQVDWYMQNLVKRSTIDFAWACIEPDIDKFTGAVDKSSNHVHFAFSGKRLSKNSLASYMRINRKYLRDTKSLTDSMGYFTKHVGKSLSYHNLYT